MVAGLSVTAFALLARRRAWKALASVAAVLVAVALFVALLNVPTSPLAALRATPLLSRLSYLADVRHGTPGWFRLQVWQGTLDGWRRQLEGEALIPGLSPHVRSLVGYGLETQLLTLDRLALPNLGVLRARGEGWTGQYLADRAHNIVLDHLLTSGLIGVGLWALVTGALLVNGVARARAATAPGEMAVRVGAIGALVAHLVEAQVGIVTPVPLALFWIAGALCTMPAWSVHDDRTGGGGAPGAVDRRAGGHGARRRAGCLARDTMAARVHRVRGGHPEQHCRSDGRGIRAFPAGPRPCPVARSARGGDGVYRAPAGGRPDRSGAPARALARSRRRPRGRPAPGGHGRRVLDAERAGGVCPREGGRAE